MSLIPDPYVIYAKIAAAVLVIAAIAGAGFHFGKLAGDVKAANAKTALQADHAAQLSALASAWQARELQTAQATDRYVRENDQLRIKRDLPLPGAPLRVCLAPSNTVLPASDAGPDRPTAAGALPGANAALPRSGGDIRQGLFAIADEADNLLAACRRTQPVAKGPDP